MRIVSDTGWKGVKGGRCITDFSRIIFLENATKKQVDGLVELISVRDNVGWCDWRARVEEEGEEGSGVFTIRLWTTSDSSD